MTYREIMLETDENLGWCKPYISADGKNAVAIDDGRPVSMLFDGYSVDDITPDAMRRFVRAVNPDANSADIDDADADELRDLATEPLHESPCHACPWFDICAAMDEEDDDGEQA